MGTKAVLGVATVLTMATALGCGSASGPPGPSRATELPPASIEVPTSPTAPAARSPGARGYAMLADLPGAPGVIMLGGADAPGPLNLPEVWTFDDKGWRDITPPSLPSLVGFPDLTGSAFAFDANSNVGVFVDIEGHAWGYSPASNTWAQAEAGAGPSAALGSAMAYDAGSDRMILFGGLDLNASRENDETWAYDVGTNSWERMDPERSPSPRNFAAMAYDPASDRVILFGGAPAGGSVGDTWAYNYDRDAWTEMSPLIAPEARTYTSMVYDSLSDRMLIFGGSEDWESAQLGDTWVYDFGTNTWDPVEVEGPSPRGWHAMAFDIEREVAVLFGGGPSRDEYTAETWLFDPKTSRWSAGP